MTNQRHVGGLPSKVGRVVFIWAIPSSLGVVGARSIIVPSPNDDSTERFKLRERITSLFYLGGR